MIDDNNFCSNKSNYNPMGNALLDENKKEDPK